MSALCLLAFRCSRVFNVSDMPFVHRDTPLFIIVVSTYHS